MEDSPDPRTLSQIIRTAGNEIARQEVIDLTFDDSDNETPRSEAVNGTAPVLQPGELNHVIP